MLDMVVLATLTLCPGCWPEALALAQLVLFDLLTSLTVWGTYSKIATNFPDGGNGKDAVCGNGMLYLVIRISIYPCKCDKIGLFVSCYCQCLLL